MVQLSRRTLLGGAVGAATLPLAACQPRPNGEQPAAAPPGAAKIPTYTSFPAGEPERKGDPVLGIPDLHVRFPDPPPQAFAEALPKVAVVNYLAQTAGNTIPAPGNPWFEQLTDRLGGTELTVIAGTYAEYISKFQVLIASGDLPEVMMIPSVPSLPQVLESRFTDLTPFLSGDNVAKYPGLAATPSAAWASSTIDGKIWGTLNSRVPSATVMAVRGDALTRKGINPDTPLANGEEFVSMLQEISDPGRDVFAFGEDPVVYMMPILLQMLGAPNGWAEQGGTFTHAYETEQYREALEITARLWGAKVMHPQSILDDTQIRGWFDSGVTMTYCWSMSGWGSLAEAQPDWNVIMLDLPQWQGGPERAKVYDGASAVSTFNAIAKQASPDRVVEILKVLDRVSAPWGSQEYLDVAFGVRDHDYSLVDGKLTTLPAWQDDFKGWINYAGVQMGQVLFNPSAPDVARYQYDYMKRIRPTVVKNPTAGLYSETMQSKAASMDKQLMDAQYQIIQGNWPISRWDDTVKQWQTRVGNAAREDFAAAKQAGQ